jgi:hypothetical protein
MHQSHHVGEGSEFAEDGASAEGARAEEASGRANDGH